MPARMTAKPKKGTAAAERRKRRAAIERAEKKAKTAAKERDCGTCRRCRTMWSSSWDGGLEAAHLIDKQSGGDGGRYSCEPKHFVTLCPDCHRGPRSVHSGHVRMEFGPEGGDGPVRFIDQVPGARHGRCAVDGGVHTEGRFCKAFRPQ